MRLSFVRPERCPEYKSTDIKRIVYGYPSPRAHAESTKGKFALGGCVLRPPTQQCGACAHEW